jgi:hypothetical protein
VDPAALVEAAWSDPAPTDSERTTVVQTLVRMVYLNGGSTNLPRGWLPALRGRLAACGRDVTPQELSWFRSQVQDDPMVFARVPGVDLGVLAAVEERFLR